MSARWATYAAFGLFVLTVTATPSRAQAPSPTPPAPLRVMTFNIHSGHGNLAAVADLIRSADPDVVGLQEVDVHWGERSGFADQATELATALEMEVRFAPIYTESADAPGRPPRQFGVAILSRLPVLSWTNHPLTRLSTQEESAPEPLPGFLQVTVDVAGTPVDVFDTHLDFRPDPRVRTTQVAEMLALVGEGGGPTILMGDMNAPPERQELRPLLTRFTDAWTAAADPGYTFPADDPVRRIDYVLLSGPLSVVEVHVPERVASDHRPVVADLVLSKH